MRKYFVAIHFALCTAASLPAPAQQDLGQDQVQSPGTICSGTLEPPPYEVWVYADVNFKGTCANLVPGFYPNSGLGYSGFGLPNDSISSLKVGSAVRLRLFTDGVYGGNYTTFGSDYPTMPGGWNDVASSARVELSARFSNCHDLQPGEYALFRDANLSGDCVVLQYKHAYSEPIYMGIANDSVSSVDSGPLVKCRSGAAEVLALYSDGFSEGGGTPIQVASGLPPDDPSKRFLSAFNDVASAAGTIPGCFPP